MSYKYISETDRVTNGECTMKVTEDMPEWIGKDLYEEIHFTVDIDNNGNGIVIPKK